MAATVLPLTIEQNADFAVSFLVTEDGETPLDLTGATARMQVRNQYAALGGVILLEASTFNGHITIEGPAGLVHVTLRGHQTVHLDTGVIGKYDLLLYLADGRTVRLVQGSVSINRGVTIGVWGSAY